MKNLFIFIGLVLLCGVGVMTYGYLKTSPNHQIIGGDKDEHNCLIPAGYSWCEVKAKCLRTWEEACNINVSEHDIIDLLATKYHKSANDVRIEFTASDATHVRGNVKFAPFDGPGGLFLAIRNNDQWELVFDGNGSVNCPAIKALGFSANMLIGICD